jgi:uncharacterized membrane protein/predicted small lipoprotein YifL
MIRSTSIRWAALAAAVVAAALMACGGDGPTELVPKARRPGPYALRDISDALPGTPYRFNDEGDLLAWWQKFVSGGAAVAPPRNCGAVALNNRSHVLCFFGSTSDGRSLPSAYAIWDGQKMTPLVSPDTFPSTYFTGWAMNDSDEVVGTIYGPTFTNPACQTQCGVIWRNGQPTFLPVSAYQTMQMNNRLDLLGKQQDWYSVAVWFYDAATGKTRHIGDSITDARDMNDQGWVVGTLFGDRWEHREVAFLARPDGLTELGVGEANGINNAGDVVGVLDSVAVLWKGGTPSPLTFAASDTNWTVTRAMEINNRGQIVAQADDSIHAKFNRWVVLTPIAP